jgi:Aminoacyl tRNA synthetase class II, N-terminal domain
VKDLSPKDRSTIGKEANILRDVIIEAIDREKERIQKDIIDSRLQNEWEDITVPRKNEK